MSLPWPVQAARFRPIQHHQPRHLGKRLIRADKRATLGHGMGGNQDIHCRKADAMAFHAGTQFGMGFRRRRGPGQTGHVQQKNFDRLGQPDRIRPAPHAKAYFGFGDDRDAGIPFRDQFSQGGVALPPDQDGRGIGIQHEAIDAAHGQSRSTGGPGSRGMSKSANSWGDSAMS